MGKEEEPTFEELSERVFDEDPGVRFRAVKDLEKIQNKNAVDLMLQKLQDEIPGFRARAIYSLVYNPLFRSRYFEFQHAVDPLIQALEDENSQVRMYAIQALRVLKNPRAIEPIENVETGDDIVLHFLVRGTLRELNEIRAVRPVIRKLLEELLRDDIKVNESAINSLVTIEDKNPIELKRIKNALLLTLTNGKKTLEKRVKIFILRALGEYGDIDVVKSLVQELKTEDEDVKVAVVNSLRQIKDRLIIDFPNEEPESKESAIYSLNIIRYSNITKPEDIMEFFVSTLKDPNPDVKIVTIHVLGDIGDRTVVGSLIRSLSDTDIRVKAAIINALGQLEDSLAVEPLIQVLKDEDKDVRRTVVKALGQLKDKKAVDPLIHTLKDESYQVRLATINVLRQFPDMGVIDPIIEVLKDDFKEVRKTAAQALGYFKDRRAVEPLIEALNDENLEVKVAVAYALGDLRDTRAVGPLRHALLDMEDLEDEEDLEVRYVLGKQLDKILGIGFHG
ncbi:MAG: HEAT repeat domain-containing protein [Candidatus Heimdallarchaeota archaeon]|nr:HEAT repeat domain-containing protein [Candidatus Heimdallarchaeota archaeon]